MSETIGELTHTSITRYVESPCSRVDPHPQHRTMTAGGGGGYAGGGGPIHGTVTHPPSTVIETWCLGVRGLMQV